MDPETSLHVRDIAQWIADRYEVFLFMFGAVVGWFAWVWNKVMNRYATVESVDSLRDENNHAHHEIMEQMSRNQNEVLKTMLELHGRKE
jgi:hypothetical protein